MNVLITGCAGFIGFHLSQLLIKKKIKVLGIDNINNYYSQKLKNDRLNILKSHQSLFKFYKINITNSNSLKKIFKNNKVEVVIHLAAQPGVRYSIKNPKKYINTNINGFYNIIDLVRDCKVKKFIYASSSSVYGISNKFPLKESTSNTDFPESIYAATKKTNELIANVYSKIYQTKTIGLRFFTVYGEYDRPDMAIYNFTNSILKRKKIDLYNQGKNSRDFTYVLDVVKLIYKLVKSEKIKNNYSIYNISNNKNYNVEKMINILEKNLGIKSKKNLVYKMQGDVIKTDGDNKKLLKDLGIVFKYTKLEEGLKKYIKWHKRYYNE